MRLLLVTFCKISVLKRERKLKSKFIKAMAIGACVLAAGCVQKQWVNRDNSSANYAKDKAFCENEAMRNVQGSAAVVASSSSQAPQSYRSSCSTLGGITSCNTTANQPAQSPAGAFLQGFANSRAASGSSQFDRDKYTDNCLTQKGWTRERPSK